MVMVLMVLSNDVFQVACMFSVQRNLINIFYLSHKDSRISAPSLIFQRLLGTLWLLLCPCHQTSLLLPAPVLSLYLMLVTWLLSVLSSVSKTRGLSKSISTKVPLKLISLYLMLWVPMSLQAERVTIADPEDSLWLQEHLTLTVPCCIAWIRLKEI